jgi:hypothetical protein
MTQIRSHSNSGHWQAELITHIENLESKSSADIFCVWYKKQNVNIFEILTRHPPVQLKEKVSQDFRPSFFCQTITPRPQFNTLKYFRILFRIRQICRDIRF